MTEQLPSLRIVIVNQHPDDVIGGSEIQCDIIATGLARLGHQVHYVAVSGRTSQEYERSYPVVPVARNAHAIAREILALQPDIVYWRFNKHCFAGVMGVLHRAGIPVVFSVSHVRDVTRFYLQPGLWKSGGLRALRRGLKEGYRLYREHRGFAHVSAIISNNSDYLGRIPIPLQAHIPNSMTTTVVPFEWPRPFCVWVANLKERKQPERYIELAGLLRDTGVDFLMVGQVQSKSYLTLLQAHDIPSNFHYLGPKTLEEVNGMLSESLFLVHTCLPEGFSNNFIQAWLQGKTVVSLAFDPGGLLVSQGLGDFADGSMALFADQVRLLISDPALRQKRGAATLEYARSHFLPEINVAKLNSVLNAVATNRRRGESSTS